MPKRSKPKDESPNVAFPFGSPPREREPVESDSFIGPVKSPAKLGDCGNADAKSADQLPLKRHFKRSIGWKALPTGKQDGSKLLHKSKIVRYKYNIQHTITDRPLPSPGPLHLPAIDPHENTPEGGVGTKIDALLAVISTESSYLDQASRFAELNHRFKQQVASRLQPKLNAHVQEMPRETYEDKKAIGDWVNAELEKFGLALRCPKTGLPAQLKGDPGNWPKIGRFQFQVVTGTGRPKRTVSTDTLPVLELIDAHQVTTPESKWQQAVGPKDSRTGRDLP